MLLSLSHGTALVTSFGAADGLIESYKGGNFMARLISCELCGRQVSSEAASCPGCGHNIANMVKNQWENSAEAAIALHKQNRAVDIRRQWTSQGLCYLCGKKKVAAGRGHCGPGMCEGACPICKAEYIDRRSPSDRPGNVSRYCPRCSYYVTSWHYHDSGYDY